MTVINNVGAFRQTATLDAPVTTPDSDGGYTESWAPLTPSVWRCAIEKKSASVGAEHHFASTVLARATHILTGRFHPAITAKARVSWTDRAGAAHVASVLDVEDPEGMGVQTIVAVAEIVP